MSSALPSRPALAGDTSRFIRVLARRLAAYIPTSLTRKILLDQPPVPGMPRIFMAATMFADLSGFTHLAELWAKEGERGTEALSQTLLMTFTALINAIHDAGGDVCHFHGDAMMIYFTDTDGMAAARALASAKLMQRLVETNIARQQVVQISELKKYSTLSIKIGVGYGRCLEMIVGDADHMEFLLGGTAIDEAVSAEQRAKAGQVVASRAALEAAGLSVGGAFRVVNELLPVPGAHQRLHWEAYGEESLRRLVRVLPAFIPPSLVERLRDHNSQPISDHRSVTSLFVRFEGIHFDNVEDAKKLQDYFQWARQIVQRYGGLNSRVNRVLTGDKGSQLHILFGAPVAPDAPEQAVRCALALQHHRPDFITTQRIGLTTGRVFAGVVGSMNRREYTIVGRMVNLSARLTQVCPPNGILIDSATAERIQPQIISKPLPPANLKGHGEPVEICQVIGEQTVMSQAQTRFQRWTKPPLGRENELAQLYGRMAEALQGQGGLVAISGPHGSGQMPFLSAGVHHWLAAGGRALWGICQQQTRDLAYAPWVSVCRSFFELSPDLEVPEQIALVRQRLHNLAPAMVDSAFLWSELLGVSWQTPGTLVELTAEERQLRLIKLVLASIEAAAAVQPLLIVLEDIHQADDASLELIKALARHSPKIPLLLLISFRSGVGFQPHFLDRNGSRTIDLDDFTPQQARRLVRERLGTDQLPKIVEQRLGMRDPLGRESPVNPLFLEESLQMMLALKVIDVDEVQRNNGRIRFDEARLASMEVPDTVNTFLLSRLDKLPAAARSLLQTASVIGREFDLPTLLAVSPGLNQESALNLLQTLIRAGLVQPLATEAGAAYLFRDSLVHQVVYQSLTYARRQALHANIAELIIQQSGVQLSARYPVLAYHLSQTGQHEKGLLYAQAAAIQAEAQHNYRVAADFYQQAARHLVALGVAGRWQTAVSLDVSRAKVLLRLGQASKAAILASEAMKLCLDHEAMSQVQAIYNLIAEIRLRQARYEEVPPLVGKVINTLLPYTPSEDLGQAYFLWGQSLAALANWPAAADKLGQAEKIFRASGQLAPLIYVLIAKAEVKVSQQLDRAALSPIDEALSFLREGAEPRLLGQTHLALSRVQLRLGQADMALEAAETAVAYLGSAGSFSLARGLTQRAAVHIYLGQFDKAEKDLELSSRLHDGMDDRLGKVRLYLLWAGDFCSGLGNWQQAKRLLHQVESLLKDRPDNGENFLMESLRFWLAQGVISLEAKQLARAESWLRKVKKAMADGRLSWWQPAALYAWGLLQLARVEENGDQTAVSEAHQVFQEARQAVEAGGCPDELPLILLQVGLTGRQLGNEHSRHYLETAVQAALQRARHVDRLYVFRQAGEVGSELTDSRPA